MGKESKRLASLDLLGAVAVILVLGRHADVVPRDHGILLYGLTGVWGRGGWIGVDLFFVLSGFLIAGLLFREHQQFGEIRIGRFFIRRGLKIYPPFFVLLAVTLLVHGCRGSRLPLQPILGEMCFLQNYLGGIWNHTWSLAVEEHFYLLLPITLVFCTRWSRHAADPFGGLVPLFIVLGISLLALRVCTACSRSEFGYEACLYPTHLRIDSLAFGVLCAYYFHYQREGSFRLIARRRALFAAIGVVLLLPAFVFRLESTPLIYTLGLTGFYLGAGALLCSVVAGELKGGPLLAVLARIGAYSYSIYLWHMPVRWWLIPFLEKSAGLKLSCLGRDVLFVAGSILCGVVMGKVVEYPILRLRDRFFPSRSGTWFVKRSQTDSNVAPEAKQELPCPSSVLGITCNLQSNVTTPVANQ